MRLTIVNCGDPDEYAVVKYQPMAPAYLAAYTPKDWRIELVDENFAVFDPERCCADVVAFSGLPRHIDRAYAHARVLRRRGIVTVGGGLHVSAAPEEARAHFDCIVVGECEPVWAEVLRDCAAGRPPPRYDAGFDAPLDQLRLPDRRFTHPGYRIASLSTSRGCENHCSFCYMGSLRRKAFRLIPTEQIIEDLRRVRQRMVVLTDESFLGFTAAHLDARRELCEAIIRSGVRKYWAAQVTADVARHPDLCALLHRAGCRMLFIGFETLGARALASINKRLNATLDYTQVVRTVQGAGIGVAASFILGLDTHDAGYGATLKEWLDEARPLFLNLGVLTPLPNTPLYHKARREGRLLADGITLWKHLDKATNTLRYRHVSGAEVDRTFEDVTRHFFRPTTVARTFLHRLLVRREIGLSLLYLGAALRKRTSRCRSVGFARVPTRPVEGGVTAGERHGNAPAVDLSLLSWNVDQWPIPGRRARSRRELQVVRAYVDQFDIVCLQECWSRRSQDLRRDFPFHYLAREATPLGFDSGLLILAKYPIREGAFHRFRSRSFPDSLAAKGVALAWVDVPGWGEIEVINTHLHAGSNARVRTRQIDELERFVAERTRGPVALLAGDLNLDCGSWEYRRLRERLRLRDLLHECPVAAGRARPRWSPMAALGLKGRPAPLPDSDRRVDHLLLLARSGVESDVLASGIVPGGGEESFPSDHCGVYVRLRLAAGRSAALAEDAPSTVKEAAY